VKDPKPPRRFALHYRIGALALLLGMVAVGFRIMEPFEAAVFDPAAPEAAKWKALALMALVGGITVIAPFKAYDALVAIIENWKNRGERQ